MKSSLDIENILKSRGLKLTKARKAILRHITSGHDALSVDDLYEKLGELGTDLSTIYRATEALEKANILTRVDFQDGFIRYEYNPEGHAHHHHVICRECGKRQCVNLCVQKTWKSELKALGFQQVSHRLEFFGLCPSCST